MHITSLFIHNEVALKKINKSINDKLKRLNEIMLVTVNTQP